PARSHMVPSPCSPAEDPVKNRIEISRDSVNLKDESLPGSSSSSSSSEGGQGFGVPARVAEKGRRHRTGHGRQSGANNEEIKLLTLVTPSLITLPEATVWRIHRCLRRPVCST